MVRLKLACISPEYHAHTREHSHSYLNLHPGQQTTASTAAASNSAASASSPSIFQLGSKYKYFLYEFDKTIRIHIHGVNVYINNIIKRLGYCKPP